MTEQQAIRLIDRLLDQAQQRKLNDLESTIVLQTWEGNTYKSIANQLSYDFDYIKQVAARLWKSLSTLLGERISKSNIKSVLTRYQISTAEWSDLIGPMLLAEHEQNLPGIGVGNPDAATIAQLRQRPDPNAPRNEVWGVPWHSDDGFNGLAYCIGGRSLFWGGWAPRFLKSEMPVDGPSLAKWPKQVVDDLHANGEELWNDAAHQIGVDDPNDFLNGELHKTLRQVFFEAVEGEQISHMIPLGELPDYIAGDKLAALPPGSIPPAPESLRLDAPYAVQSTTRSGFFPFNKFSSVPLMIGAARQAAMDSQKSDDQALNNSRRQVMVVPNCHIKRLNTLPVGTSGLRRVVSIETSQGTIDVAHNAIVVFGMAAIESARLALDSFPGIISYNEIGKNLMVHLRTNTQFRVKRNNPIFTGFKWDQLEVSGIQLRGRINHSDDSTQGHFHLQVAVSGVPAGQGNAHILHQNIGTRF